MHPARRRALEMMQVGCQLLQNALAQFAVADRPTSKQRPRTPGRLLAWIHDKARYWNVWGSEEDAQRIRLSKGRRGQSNRDV